jgi:hypothetical protein
MKLTIAQPSTINPDAIQIVFPVDDQDVGEDGSIPADFPGLVMAPGKYNTVGTVTMTLDLDTRKVRDWPEGRTESVYVKVTDQLSCYLLEDGKVIAEREENYQPGCIPGEYGDYVIMDIAADGTILKDGRPWTPELDDIAEAFDLG